MAKVKGRGKSVCYAKMEYYTEIEKKINAVICDNMDPLQAMLLNATNQPQWDSQSVAFLM